MFTFNKGHLTDLVQMGPRGLPIANIVRPRQDYFPSIQKQMKRDSHFSNRNSFFRDLTKGLRGVKINTGNPPPSEVGSDKARYKNTGGAVV